MRAGIYRGSAKSVVVGECAMTKLVDSVEFIELLFRVDFDEIVDVYSEFLAIVTKHSDDEKKAIAESMRDDLLAIKFAMEDIKEKEAAILNGA